MQDKEQYCNIIYKIEHYFCFLFHSYLNSLKCLSNERTDVGQRKKSKCGIGLAWVYCIGYLRCFIRAQLATAIHRRHFMCVKPGTQKRLNSDLEHP